MIRRAACWPRTPGAPSVGMMPGLVLTVICGCSVAGTWRVKEITPATSLGTYPVSRITFDDYAMTYAANSDREDHIERSTGSYDWDGFHTLTLRPKDKPERIYKGYLWWGTLKLTGRAHGQAFRATLIRDEAR